MNKLYVIRFLISHDYCISTWSCWNPASLNNKMARNPEWTFSLKEDNDTHQIWEAR